jgi:hypothetical protein
MYGFIADGVLVLHVLFVLFVAFGGLLTLKWRSMAWLHLPALAWGVALELGGWICPLTPLENHLRGRGGEETYTGDFVARYLVPVLYPEGLTRDAQVALGLAALLFNVGVYGFVVRQRLTRQASARLTVPRGGSNA